MLVKFSYLFCFVIVSKSIGAPTECKYDAESIRNLYESSVKFRNGLENSDHENLTQYSHELSDLFDPPKYILGYSLERTYFSEGYHKAGDNNVTVNGEYYAPEEKSPVLFNNTNNDTVEFSQFGYKNGEPNENYLFSVPLSHFIDDISDSFFLESSFPFQSLYNSILELRQKAFDFLNSLDLSLQNVFYINGSDSEYFYR